MPHDAEAMALLSSAGHWLVGAFVLPVAILVALEADGQLTGRAWRFGVPALIILSGAALAAFIVFHAGVDRAPEMLRFALGSEKQIQHFILAGLVALIGLSEWRARDLLPTQTAWRFIWPAAYLLTGFGLIIHEQTGPDSATVWAYHVLLGGVVASAAVARLAQVSGWVSWRLSGFFFAGLLFVEAAMLFFYQAPS